MSIFKKESAFEMPQNRPLTDKNGRELSGDEIFNELYKFVSEFDNKGQAVPVSDQRFIAWLRQYKELRDKGQTCDEILKATVAGR